MSFIQAIPASAIVNVTPSVLSAGGVALDLNGLILTTSWRIPVGTPTGIVRTFASQADVGTFFGPSSQEAALAGTYFLGFDDSTQKPGAILFAQYNQGSVGAWVRGGSITASGISLTALQAMSGTLIVTIDGTLRTSSPINLSSATSFSSAAELMTIGLGLVGATAASFTGAISGTTLTVSGISSGAIAVGQEVRGSGVTAGTVVSQFVSGVGGNGTYTVTATQTVSSEAMTTVVPTITYDSVSGSFVVVSPTTGLSSTVTYVSGTLAASVLLTQETGATISQGVLAASPAAFMANVVAQTQNWASFMTAFDPDNGSGNTVKQAFAAWVNSAIDRYVYVCWDTDITPTLSTNATTSLGNIIKTANSNGVVALYSPLQGPTIAAFELGAIASVDFSATEGRATMKFRSQTGIVPDITNQTISNNLDANGYNYYAAVATANDVFNFQMEGQISGPFTWIDSYINQIWMNNQFQLALVVLMVKSKSIPYNDSGYAKVRAALLDPIKQAVNFGAIRAGVPLGSSEIVQVNGQAGKKIDDTLYTQGWYLLIQDATAQVRANRGPPPCTFWYMDGQSIQKLSLASTEIQ